MKKFDSTYSDSRAYEPYLGIPRIAVTAEKYNPADAAKNITSKKTPKSLEETKQIRECLTHIFLFDSLSPENIKEVIDYMFIKNVKANEEIITEKDAGDNFYVISKGSFEAYQNGKLVKTYKDSGYFGELSLMYNTPRSATIKSTSNGKLWSLDRDCFRRFILQNAYERRDHFEKLLKSNKILKLLPENEKSLLIDSLSCITLSDQIIFKEGTKSERFYFIESGLVEILIKDKVKKRLNDGEFFGEESILFNRSSSFTARTKGDTNLGSIDKDSFKIIFIPIKDAMEKHCTQFIKSLN